MRALRPYLGAPDAGTAQGMPEVQKPLLEYPQGQAERKGGQMSKVVAYCRVSSEAQEAEGTSLDTQERACLAKAQELVGPGDEVVILREVFSGLTLERPELTRLREWVKEGQVKAVITYCADRLARDGLYLLLLVEEFEKAGAIVVFVTEPHEDTPEGQLLTYVRGWASKLEALKIKERTVRGRRERARRGCLPGGSKLYGYLYIKGKGEGRGIRIPDTEKASIVRNIFGWYVQEGLSLEGIAKRLYSLGIPSPRDKGNWQAGTLLRLLTNPAYTGQTITRWQVGDREETMEIPGATPALIDKATFEAAQERMRLNKENAKRRGKRDYLLRGMVFCACGRRLVGASPGGRRSYRCTGHTWHPERHCERTVGADNLERAVWDKIKAILSEPQTVRAEIEQRSGNTQGMAELEAQIKTIEARLKALAQGEAIIARKLRLGELSEAVGTRELRQGQQDRAILEREKATLEGQLETARRWVDLDIDALCKAARANLESPTPELQRLALQALGTRATVGSQEIKLSIALPVDHGDESFVLQPLRRGLSNCLDY